MKDLFDQAEEERQRIARELRGGAPVPSAFLPLPVHTGLPIENSRNCRGRKHKFPRFSRSKYSPAI
jgi:hypothetical protein